VGNVERKTTANATQSQKNGYLGGEKISTARRKQERERSSESGEKGRGKEEFNPGQVSRVYGELEIQPKKEVGGRTKKEKFT